MADTPRLAVVRDDARAAIVNLDRLTQPPVILDNIALAIWDELRVVRDPAVAARRLALGQDVDDATVLRDVQAASETLTDLGLL